MKLGILVNSNKNLDAIVGLTESAVEREHEVTLFIMDEGTHLLEENSFCSLAESSQVNMSYCEHSAVDLGVDTSHLTEAIESSSQYNNAAMNHNMDKVVVL